MKLLVLDLGNRAAPLQLVTYDGNKPVPEGGILLLSPPDEPGTAFPSREAADAAIDRTVAHGAAQEYGPEWDRETFLVVDAAHVEAILKDMRKDRRKNDPKDDPPPPAAA